ncbi:MAG: dipeptide ABC transporter ATP binding subunit DppF, partial [Hyphomicrobiales bacterium]|nr:dipeptide ABC transporter ATP binding subunit DppF [Hyphomicrobiales bacterium]
DVSIQAQVLNILADLQEKMQLSYLFISHDLAVVKHVADDIMVMYLGRPVETGSAAAILEAPKHPYTKALLSATPIADPAHRKERIRLEGELPSPIDPPTGCPFHPRCRYAETRCRIEVPAIKASDGQMVACHAVEEGRI